MESNLIDTLKNKNIKIGIDTTRDTYTTTPIDTFGVKILTKLGWKQGDGIGRNTSHIHIEPIEYVPRNHRLGLGATPSIKGYKEYMPSKFGSKNYKAIGEQLIPNTKFEIGSEIQIVNGKHSEMYGRIIGKYHKEDEEYAVIELLANDTKVEVLIEDILPSHQIKLNKRPKPDTCIPIEIEPNKELQWVLPTLMVIVSSKTFRNGKYYQSKGVISDVLDKYRFSYIAKDGVVIDDLAESQIDVVQPGLMEWAMPIKGENKGVIGRVIKIADDVISLQLDDDSIIRVYKRDCCAANI